MYFKNFQRGVCVCVCVGGGGGGETKYLVNGKFIYLFSFA